MSPAAKSPPKDLSSEESSEDEEDEEAVGDGVEPGGRSPRLLPSSVLDRASAIAHHFTNSVRRSSMTQEDVRLSGCPSPRPRAPTSSLRAEPVPPQPPETTETDLTVLSPGEDSFWDGEVGRRRDSTLSRQDQLLISKIRRYYEDAGSRSPTCCLQRRESLTSIPPGLVRSSVSRINSSDTTSWLAAAPPATGDQALSESLDTFSLQLRSTDGPGQGQRSRHQSSWDEPSEEEEFLPSSQMIRIWQEMEQKVTLAQQESRRSKLAEAPQSFMASGLQVPEAMKVQDRDSPPDSQELQERPQTEPEAGGEQTRSKVLHLARQYSQRIRSARPVVRQQSQGLLRGQGPLACVVEELERTETSGWTRSASLLAQVPARRPTSTLFTDKPRPDPRNQAEPSPLSRPAEDHPPEGRPAEGRPAEGRPPEGRPCQQKVTSTDQVQSGSVAQSSLSTEAFDWPDVQHLRSRYSSGGGGGQGRGLSRARSMPERLLVRRHSSCSCLVLPEGPCLRVPWSRSGDGWDTEECRWRLQRAASVDLHPRSRAGAAQQLAYVIAATAPRPDDPEHSVIVMETVQQPRDTAEEDAEDNYVQIRSPTSKEKISLLAVMDRCRVYQDPDGSREEAVGRRGPARPPDQESRGSRSRQDSSRQGRVKNLREKFQSMS